MALPGEIKCLFFSEFDPIAGPKISFQVLIVNQVVVYIIKSHPLLSPYWLGSRGLSSEEQV